MLRRLLRIRAVQAVQKLSAPVIPVIPRNQAAAVPIHTLFIPKTLAFYVIPE